MTGCEDALVAFLLDQVDAAAVDHIRTCPRCRAEQPAVRALAVRLAADPAPTPPPTLAPRVLTAAGPLLARNAQGAAWRAAWPAVARALAAALIPLPAILVFDVPLTAKDELIRDLEGAGIVRLQTSTRNAHVPDNELATAHIDVTLTSSGPIVPSDEGLWLQVRTSLFYSFKLLSWSVMFVVVGLSVVLPWIVLLWAGYRVVSRLRKRPVASTP